MTQWFVLILVSEVDFPALFPHFKCSVILVLSVRKSVLFKVEKTR